MEDIATVAERLARKIGARKEQGLAIAREVNYKCSDCKDVGFVRGDYPQGHSLFGRVVPCPTCGVTDEITQTGYTDSFGLYPADRGLTWASIVDFEEPITQARDVVRELLEKGSGMIYLYGGYGTAKTMILKVAVAEYLRNTGQMAVYLRMSDLMDEIRAAYDEDKPQVALQAKIKHYSALGLLAIDEIEKVGDSSFVTERRFQILDSRYELAIRERYGITILAGNVGPDRLEGAIASRVKDSRFHVIQINAPDMRKYGRHFEEREQR